MNANVTTQNRPTESFAGLDKAKSDIYDLYSQYFYQVPSILKIKSRNLNKIHQHFHDEFDGRWDMNYSYIEVDFSEESCEKNQMFYYLKNCLIHFDIPKGVIMVLYGGREENFVFDLVKKWKGI